jgi:hypothetical protein
VHEESGQLEQPTTSSTKKHGPDPQEDNPETQNEERIKSDLRLELPGETLGKLVVGNEQSPEDESPGGDQPSSGDQSIKETQERALASATVEHDESIHSDPEHMTNLTVREIPGEEKGGEDSGAKGSDEDFHHEHPQELSNSISKTVPTPQCLSFSRKPYSVCSDHSIPPDVDEYYFELEILEDFGKK